MPNPNEVSENLRGEAKSARLKSIGLFTLVGLGAGAAVSMVALGVVAILGGVGTLPFFGAGTAGIVAGTVLIGAGLGLGLLSAGIYLAASNYKLDAATLDRRTRTMQFHEDMDPTISDDNIMFDPPK